MALRELRPVRKGSRATMMDPIPTRSHSLDVPAAGIRVEKRNALISNLRHFALHPFFEKYMTQGPRAGRKLRRKTIQAVRTTWRSPLLARPVSQCCLRKSFSEPDGFRSRR